MFWDRCCSCLSRKDLWWVLFWYSWKQISRKLYCNLMLWMSFVSSIFIIIATRFIFHFRYTCTFIDQHFDDKFFMWNVSVSDHCCQHCDGVVYKADSVVETVLHEDKCGTVETSICRILPGHFSLTMFLKWF